ncbi:hypothetical protein SDC9_199625 [bioreactor metagenome]|uniref:Uncharacterized protein n=1 Tax=bioreactor metagenome TaxID=1076179 RepID=A0A645IXP2_9ZZZZ
MEPIYPVNPPMIAIGISTNALLVPSNPLNGNNLGKANQGAAATLAQSYWPNIVDNTTPTATTEISMKP